MARRVQTRAVTAQMYRHFAALTLAVTLVVGLFADGESRKAVASEVAKPRPAPRAGPAALARKDTRTQGGFADDTGFDGTFGAPMDLAGATAQDGWLPVDLQLGPGEGMPGGYNEYGVSAEVWASLTPAQKQALIARHKAELAAAQAQERRTDISRLLAASRARSGEATAAD